VAAPVANRALRRQPFQTLSRRGFFVCRFEMFGVSSMVDQLRSTASRSIFIFAGHKRGRLENRCPVSHIVHWLTS